MEQRIEYFDIAKGILILLVVIGHIFETGPINQFVYSFHMPAFFITSGIMQHYSSAMKKPLKKAILAKVYSLLVPFLFFEAIGVLSSIVRYGPTLNMIGYAYNTLRLWCNNGPDWFIWALFVDEVLFLTLQRFVKNRYVIWSITVCTGLFMIFNHDIYSTFGSTGVGFLFLTAGYYTTSWFIRERNGILVISAGLLSLVLCGLNGKVDLGPWEFGFVPFYIINAFSGTFFVIEGSKYISSKLLSYYGKNTLTVLGTHQAINLTYRVKRGIDSYPFGTGMLVFVVISAMEIPLIWLFNRYIPFLIGKKVKRMQN